MNNKKYIFFVIPFYLLENILRKQEKVTNKMYVVTKRKSAVEIERKQMLTNFHFIFNDFAAFFYWFKINFFVTFEWQQTQKREKY